MFRSAVAVVLLSALASAIGWSADAQQAPLGPPLAGVCLFARDAALGGSRAGAAANVRLQQLGAQIEAELTPEQQAIIKENTALQASPPTVSAAQRQQRLASLQRRAQAFTQLQNLRAAQLQQTRLQATQAIVAQIDPLLGPLASARRCSVVFERTATYGFNAAMDLTPSLVDQLNQRLPTVQFNLATPESVRR